VGTLYIQLGHGQTDAYNRVSLIYLCTLFLSYSAQSRIPEIFNLRTVYFREHQSNMYSPRAYYMARFCADVPYNTLEVLIFTVILYFVVGLRTDDGGIHLGAFYLCLFTLRLCAYAFIETCANATPVAEAATALVAVSFTIFMLFAGFLIPKTSIPKAWLWMYYASFFRYPLDFLTSNELSDLPFSCSDSQYITKPLFNATCNALCTKCSDTGICYYCPIKEGNTLLDQYGIDYLQQSSFIWVLCIFFVGFRITSFLTHRFINHVKR